MSKSAPGEILLPKEISDGRLDTLLSVFDHIKTLEGKKENTPTQLAKGGTNFTGRFCDISLSF